jgi:hypothetical protein
MRRACFLLVVLFGSWSSSLGQSAPKFTSPRIVATFERLGVTAGIPPTTIYTPKNWGTFRISIVLVCTVANGDGNANWRGDVVFTDGAGNNSGSLWEAAVPTQIRGTRVTEFPIRAKAGIPIKFSVTPFGQVGGSKYNVWVVVEQLM